MSKTQDQKLDETDEMFSGKINEFTELWQKKFNDFNINSHELRKQLVDRHIKELDHTHQKLSETIPEKPKASSLLLALRKRQYELAKQKK